MLEHQFLPHPGKEVALAATFRIHDAIEDGGGGGGSLDTENAIKL